MNKIDEILNLQKQSTEINHSVIDKLDELVVSTEKYIFSISLDKGVWVNIRNKRQDVTLPLDVDETKALYEFLSNILDEKKMVSGSNTKFPSSIKVKGI